MRKLPIRDVKSLLYLFETCLKCKYLDSFPMRFCEACATVQSVITCFAVTNKNNESVYETWILPIYFYSTFAWARETFKSNVKLKPSINKYPIPSRLT